MKQRLSKAAVVALSVLGAWGTPASAAIRESVTFNNVPSMDAQGDVDNVKHAFSLTGGYAMSTLHITGVITNPNATASRANQSYVRAKRPNNTFVNIQLSQSVTQASGGASVSLARATLVLDGMDPAGNWEFEFYEATDNLANGADMVWTTITFDFEDNLGGPTGADVRLCQLYGLYMPIGGRVGSTVGLALGTTSWNVGTRNLIWSAEPDNRHPFIIQNMYRLKDDRFEQIGMSWVKHGYFALSDLQCGGFCNTTSGNFLGVGCTDTYDPGLNADQSGLGPRNEINPWTGSFTYSGSVYQQGIADNGITRRLQVRDTDLDTTTNIGALYFIEGMYVCRDDVDVTNNAAWKQLGGVTGFPGQQWTFTQSVASVPPWVGFAADAWPGAQKVTLAQELPVNEATSPDGRCVLYHKVTDNGNGTFHYEYALLNVDMSRQVGDFVVDCPPGVTVSNIGFSAPLHHNESLNLPAGQGGVAINNNPWTGTRETNAVRWSTSTNPLRWGTLYNFRFDASTGPNDGQVTLNMFTPGVVMQVAGTARTPSAPAPPPPCPGDADGNGVVNFSDVTAVLTNFGADYSPGTGAGDANHDGPVNFSDVTAVLTNFGVPCPA